MSQFLVAAQEILTEFGEAVTIKDRNGTAITGTFRCFSNPAGLFDNYYPELGVNTDDPGHCTLYFDGTAQLESGYEITRALGTWQVHSVQTLQELDTVALVMARCSRM